MPPYPSEAPVRPSDDSMQMNPLTQPPTTPDSAVPEAWRAVVSERLAAGERVLASLEIDLDERLRFGDGLVVVTDRSISARVPGSSAWQDWALRDDLMLRKRDHAGVGTLELVDGARRIDHWCFTLGRDTAAQRLLEALELAQAARASGTDARRPPPRCTRCQAELPAGSDECPACAPAPAEAAPSTWVLFRLWRFAHPYRGQLLLGFVLTVLATAATLVPPYLTMPLMDQVLIPYQKGVPIEPETVGLYLIGLFGAALVAWILGWARTYTLALVSERMGADLRTQTYEHLLGLSLQYFGGKRTGDLMSRIGAETDRINLFLSLHLLDFATDLLMIVMTAAILASIDPWLALVTLMPLPLIAWLIHLVRDRLRTGFEKVDRTWAEVTSVLADTIPGIRVVKAFAQESREAERFREANRHNLAVNDRVNRVWSLFSPTVTLMTEIGLLIVWGFGIWQIAGDSITVGVLTAFLAYIGRFYLRLDSMSRIVSFTQKAAAGAKRIFDILDHVSSVPEPANPVMLPKVEGRIQIEGAAFRYGNRAIIRGIDLDIAPGEMIGLVGHSGSGKSTLVNLICRFYDVTDGTIRIDGTDVRSVPVAQFRRHIGLVLQEPFLFFGSIAENIAYGRPDATREQVIAAARAAKAHDFILKLTDGYDSLVGERGQSLSGGERQRISIARALLTDPRILILDEATSAVDTETEREIQEALDVLVQGRTTIAIAHRISTLRKANRIIVLERGRVTEVGNHDDLLAQQGTYYRLNQAQKNAGT